MDNVRYKVLLIEDDKIDQAAFKRLVQNEALPYDCTIVESISEAKSVLGSERFDIIIADYSLGDGTAFDILDCVKSTPIIIVTGAGGEEIAIKAWRTGAYDYLTKDIERSYLKTLPITVENAVNHSGTKRKLQLLSHAIKSTNDSVYISDMEDKIIFVNRAFCETYGYKQEDIIGKDCNILWEEGSLSADEKKAYQAGDGWEVEFYHKRKDGAVFPVSLSKSIVKDPNGNNVAIVGVARNISERMRIQEILDRKQKNLESIFDAAPIGMLLVDENMMVKRVNDAIRQMVHEDYSQIINIRAGGSLRCINSTYNEKGCGYSPGCAGCLLRQTIKSVLESEQCIHEVEINPTLKVENKEIKPWLCISIQPVMIDGLKHVVIAVDDITDRKQAEEKLKETMEIKSQFISTVSHELRTPLASMKEAISIVLDGIVGETNDEQKKFLDIAKRNVDRLASLINDVLDFQKLEAGRMKLNVRENDITEVVRGVYETMSPYAEKQAINFCLELGDNLPKAMFDGDKIVQVLTNLVSNAIKFTPEKGQVSISVQHEVDELIIRVNDTGMGIPKETLPKIFERFYRVNRPGKQIQGTGLGLSIVKKIVMMHGGRIEVESEVDKGTTFSVFLPLAGKPEQEMSTSETDEILEDTLVNK